MKEIRLHGRGGQGAASAAEMLVSAFSIEGKCSHGFPMFGFERRGAPVTAFVRFSHEPIREKTQVYLPDCVIILDPPQAMLPMTYSGLKAQGVALINYSQLLEETPDRNVKLLGIVNALEIALEELRIPALNTCMIGAFAATTQWVKLDSVLEALEQYFKGEMLKKNLRCAERGFREVRVIQF